MSGNPREIVMMAERPFPVRIKIGVPPGGFGQRYAEITEFRRELRRGWLGDNTIRPARCAERCCFDLFPRRDAGERLRRPLVRCVED